MAEETTENIKSYDDMTLLYSLLSTDVLYIIRGTGTNRDCIATMAEVLGFIQGHINEIEAPLEITYTGSGANALDVYGLSRFRGSVKFNSIATFDAGFRADGTTAFYDVATFADKAIFNDEVQVRDTMTVTGASTFDGASTFNATVTFESNATFNALVEFNGITKFYNELNVEAAAYLRGLLTVGGNATFSNPVEFEDDVSAQGVSCTSLTSSGDISAEGNISSDGDVSADGRMTAKEIKANNGVSTKLISKSSDFNLYSESGVFQSSGCLVVVRNTNEESAQDNRIKVTINNNGEYVYIDEHRALLFVRVGSNSWMPVDSNVSILSA